MYITTQTLEGNTLSRALSWRTGSNEGRQWGDSPREVVPNPPLQRKGEGSLAFRKRVNSYYRMLAANLQSNSRYQGHVLTSDGGHHFKMVRQGVVPGAYRVRYGSKYYPWQPTRACAPPVLLLDRDADFVTPSPGLPDLRGCGVGQTSRLSVSGLHLSTLAAMQDGIYNSMIPDNASFGWGETIVELLRGNFPLQLRALVKRVKDARRINPKGLSSKDLRKRLLGTSQAASADYLAARFGAEPIITDVVKTIEHLRKVHEALYDSYKRYRSSPIVYDVSDKITSIHHMVSPNVSSSFGISPVTGTVTSDLRISAKFAKIRPSVEGTDFYSRSQDVLRNMGFNEKLVWDLIPFSWLIDWSGNIGASINTATALAGANQRFLSTYGWVTRKTRTTIHVPSFRTSTPSFAETHDGSTAWSEVIERTSLSPFGPGFKLPSLTAYQWSILVALGLAKSPSVKYK